MDRSRKVLSQINPKGKGLEIGPSHRPIAPKRDGFDVEIIDHLPRQELIEKYKAHNVSLDKIEEVDYIWQGQTYAELTGKADYYDWIIASHVIEHSPDLIAFIRDCESILCETGVLCLVVPDARYCFDHFRPLSSLSQVVDAHHAKRSMHTPGTVAEYFLNVVSQEGKIAWSEHTKDSSDYAFVHSLEQARVSMAAARDAQQYFDVHAWCFTPSSFRLMIHDLYSLGFIGFQEISFFPSSGCEFYITLGRRSEVNTLDRLELLKRTQAELAGQA